MKKIHENYIKIVEYDNIYKLLILGDESTGKSCIVNNYIGDEFNTKSYPQIKVLDSISENIEDIGDKIIKLQLYDTSGKEKYRSSLKQYYKDSNGIILIYDVTNKNSFDNLENWIKEISTECPNIPIFIIGNKIDDDKHRVITTEQGKKLKEEYGLIFCECSAKNGINVDFIFKKLVTQLIIKNNDYNNLIKLMEYLSY